MQQQHPATLFVYDLSQEEDQFEKTFSFIEYFLIKHREGAQKQTQNNSNNNNNKKSRLKQFYNHQCTKDDININK